MQRSRQSEQAILANLGWVWGGLPNDGWFNYANLSERFYSPGLNIDFYDVGLLILGTSTIMGALNLFVTIVNLRGVITESCGSDAHMKKAAYPSA
jgi:heme/copper-type cytochrome/quinol oxidase subunit 1